MTRTVMLCVALAACGKGGSASRSDARIVPEGRPDAGSGIAADAAARPIDAGTVILPPAARLPPPEPLPDGEDAHALAVSGREVFLVRAGEMCEVWRYSAEGQAVEMVAQAVTPEGACPARMVVDGDHLLAFHATEVLRYRIGSKTNAASVLAQDQAEITDLLIAKDDVFVAAGAGGTWQLRKGRRGGRFDVLAERQGFGTRLALDATHVYWAAEDGIWRMPRKGGTAEHYVHADSEVTAFVLAEDAIYAALYAAIGRAPRQGGTITVVSPAFGECYELLVHGEAVYWASFFPDPPYSGVYRLVGGKAEAVATGLGEPEQLGVVGEALFWIDSRRGRTMRQPLR